MKTRLLLACLCFVVSNPAFTLWCRNCDVDVCAQVCCPYDTPCQCTDPGALWNDCIDRCTYCEAFGNIGAR